MHYYEFQVLQMELEMCPGLLVEHGWCIGGEGTAQGPVEQAHSCPLIYMCMYIHVSVFVEQLAGEL